MCRQSNAPLFVRSSPLSWCNKVGYTYPSLIELLELGRCHLTTVCATGLGCYAHAFTHAHIHARNVHTFVNMIMSTYNAHEFVEFCCLYVCLSVCRSVCLSVCLSVCVSVCLSVSSGDASIMCRSVCLLAQLFGVAVYSHNVSVSVLSLSLSLRACSRFSVSLSGCLPFCISVCLSAGLIICCW